MFIGSVAYPIAKTQSDQWVKIEDANHNDEYHCPECESPMIARLGDIKQHHFAHYPGYTGVCSGESGWHSVAKHALACKLEQLGELQFWIWCQNSHKPWCTGVLCESKKIIESIKEVKVEKAIDCETRPDILIKLHSGKEVYGEIVYKNPISIEKYAKYYSSFNYLLVWNLDISEPMGTPPFNTQIPHEYYRTIMPDTQPGISLYTHHIPYEVDTCPGPLKDNEILLTVRKLLCPHCQSLIPYPTLADKGPLISLNPETNHLAFEGDLQLREKYIIVHAINHQIKTKLDISKKGFVYHKCPNCRKFISIHEFIRPQEEVEEVKERVEVKWLKNAREYLNALQSSN